MHAVSCLPAITGAWRLKGGGAFFASFDIWNLDTTRTRDRLGGQRYAGARSTRIGAVLCGDEDALAGGHP